MSAIEYAMVLISIIVGLGVTHILSSLGTAVHRLRGNGKPLRLELNYLAWIAFIFGWLVRQMEGLRTYIAKIREAADAGGARSGLGGLHQEYRVGPPSAWSSEFTSPHHEKGLID